jgi:hypothetical protein
MENDIKKNKKWRMTKKEGKKENDLKKKRKKNQSTKINLIGRDTIVNSPSLYTINKSSEFSFQICFSSLLYQSSVCQH